MEKTRDDKHLVYMDNTRITSDYLQAVKAIKQAILESRYRAARLVNKEVLALYYAIGGFISFRSRTAQWGTNAIGVISELLQFTILSLVETVGIDEQPLSFDVIDYLTLELQHGPHADGSIGQHVHEPSVGFTVCCGFNH